MRGRQENAGQVNAQGTGRPAGAATRDATNNRPFTDTHRPARKVRMCRCTIGLRFSFFPLNQSISMRRLFLLPLFFCALPALAQDVPAPELALVKPATMGYTMTMAAMGQEIVITSTRTVEETQDGWQIIDEATLPPMMGGVAMVDTFEVDPLTLRATRRALSAGPMGAARLAYTEDGVTGEMSQQGQSMPIEVTFETATLSDGSAFELFVSALPLVVGSVYDFTIYSPQGMGSRPMQMEITGEESITVPAGTFDTYVASFTPQDGNDAGTATLYLAKDGAHVVVKSVASMGAAMGGGTTTTELTRYDR